MTGGALPPPGLLRVTRRGRLISTRAAQPAPTPASASFALRVRRSVSTSCSVLNAAVEMRIAEWPGLAGADSHWNLTITRSS